MDLCHIITLSMFAHFSHGLPQFGGFAQIGEVKILTNGVPRDRLSEQGEQEKPQQPVAKAQTLLVEAKAANITEQEVMHFLLDNTRRVVNSMNFNSKGNPDGTTVSRVPDTRSLVNNDGGLGEATGKLAQTTGNFITNRLSAVGNTTSRILQSGMEFMSQSVGASVALMGSMANVGLNALIDVSDATDQFITRSMDDTVNLIRGAVEEYSGLPQGAVRRSSTLSR